MKTPNTTNNNPPGFGGLSGVKIPAGLADQYAEMYSDGGLLKGTHNGQTKSYTELPRIIQYYFEGLYLKHKKDNTQCQVYLVEYFGCQTYTDQVIQHTLCNYGGYDINPDFIPGKAPKTEYWNCGHRGNCDAEGIVCYPECIVNYKLTPREIEIIKLTAQGKQSKEIADTLKISDKTVYKHEQNIHNKLSCNNNKEIVRFAYENNIIF